MKQLFDQASYVCSEIITTKYSTSFSSAVKMLSPRIQPAIHAVYGFVRVADEIVDSFHMFDKEMLLDEFQESVRVSIERKISLNPILNSFQEVVNKYEIDHALIKAFFDSMRADLNKIEYNTQEEYNEYIYGSADVVGLMCLKIFVEGDAAEYERLKAPAMRLGSAFQKVNFLRDLKADTEELNRTYFPHFSGTLLNDDSKKVIIEEIEADFDEAYKGIKELPEAAKFGVYTAYMYYRKLLTKLTKAEVKDIQSSRIRVSAPVKFGLLAKSFVSFKLNLI